MYKCSNVQWLEEGVWQSKPGWRGEVWSVDKVCVGVGGGGRLLSLCFRVQQGDSRRDALSGIFVTDQL